MKCLSSGMVSVAVASALLTGTYVLGQVQKAAAPQAKEEARPEPKPEPNKAAMTKIFIVPNAFIKGVPAPAKAAAKEAVKSKAVAKGAAAPKAAMKAAVVIGRPGIDANVLKAQTQQFIQQFRPLLRAEYHVVRKVCDPPPEQRRKIAREGERGLKEAARKYVEMQFGGMGGRRAWSSDAADPRLGIQQFLARAVKENLSPEQTARYEREIEKKTAYRKRVAVDNIVAVLDQRLVLTKDQREKLNESLTSHWDDAWCRSMDTLVYIEHYFPNIPSQFVTPFLNPSQKRVWETIPKNHGIVFGGVMINGMMGDDPLEDEDLAEARKAEADLEKQKAQ